MKILVTQKQLTNLVENKEKIILKDSEFVKPQKLNKSVDLQEGVAHPLQGNPRVSSPWGPRKGGFHGGTDFAVKVGTPVMSAESGEVEQAFFASGDYNAPYYEDACGGTIVIQHYNGYRTGYCHMSQIDVKVGDKVEKGNIIGLSGGKPGEKGAGNSRGPHLHFTVKQNGERVNPMNHIDMSNVSTPTSITPTSPITVTSAPPSTVTKRPTPIDDTYFTKKGDVNGERVEVLQEILTAAGYETEVDGDYGNLTMDSVREVKDDLDIDTVATYVMNDELIKIVNRFGEIQGDEIEIKGKKLPIDLSKVTSDTTTTTTTSTTRPSDNNRMTTYGRDIIVDAPKGAYGESFNLIYGSTQYINSGKVRKLFLESNSNEFKQHNFIFADRGVPLSKIKRFIKDEFGTSSNPNIDTITLVGASATDFTENPSETYDRYFFVNPYLTKAGMSTFYDKSPNYGNMTVLSNPNFFKSKVEQFDSLKVLNDLVIKGGGDAVTGTEGTIAMLKSFFKNYYNPL